MPAVAEVANNPVAVNPGGLSSFFNFLGTVLNNAKPLTDAYLTGEVAKQNARTQADVQSIINRNHNLNPSTGANDPKAAAVAADKTFLDTYLPPQMLYTTDAGGVRKLSPVYYLVVLFLVLALVWFVRKMFK